MNEQLQKHLVSIITSISDAVKATATFAWEQASDIAVSYVLYGRIWYTFLAIIIMAYVVLSFIGHVKLFKYGMTVRSDDGKVAVHGLNVMWGAGSVTLFCNTVPDKLQSLVMVYAAPKVWLIQELARMVK